LSKLGKAITLGFGFSFLFEKTFGRLRLRGAALADAFQRFGRGSIHGVDSSGRNRFVFGPKVGLNEAHRAKALARRPD
jgi:hypothetical protein